MSRAAARIPRLSRGPSAPAPLDRGRRPGPAPSTCPGGAGHPAPGRPLAPEGPRTHPALLANVRVPPGRGQAGVAVSPRAAASQAPRLCVRSKCGASLPRTKARGSPARSAACGGSRYLGRRGGERAVPTAAATPDSEARPAPGGSHNPRPRASELSGGAGQGWGGAAESSPGHAPRSRPRPPSFRLRLALVGGDECSGSWVRWQGPL